MRLLSNAPTQRSYAINDQFNRFSYNSENPDASGVWALPVPIVSVPINARVGHTISLELKLASDAVSDVRFVDNDGNTSMSASLAWSFEGPGDVILISHLVGGEPPEIGAVTPTSLESSVLPFPDPFAPVVGPGVPVTGPIGSVVLAFALLTGGGLHLMRTAAWRLPVTGLRRQRPYPKPKR